MMVQRELLGRKRHFVWIFDRGFADVKLMKLLKKQNYEKHIDFGSIYRTRLGAGPTKKTAIFGKIRMRSGMFIETFLLLAEVRLRPTNTSTVVVSLR